MPALLKAKLFEARFCVFTSGCFASSKGNYEVKGINSEVRLLGIVWAL
jgi:hypothetical protein